MERSIFVFPVLSTQRFSTAIRPAINATPNAITPTSAKPPQNGNVTHHQDQSITPQSFSVTNTTPRRPMTPIPPDDASDFVDICFIPSTSKVNRSGAVEPHGTGEARAEAV